MKGVERVGPWAPAIAVAPVFLLFAVLKVYGTFPALSDENIYFYMTVRTAFDGLWPYRDYFSPHPPLHLFLSVAVFELAALVCGLFSGSMHAGIAAMIDGASWNAGGLSLTVGKSIPATAAFAAGAAIYRAARRAGAVEAVVAAASFLLALDVLRPSSHFTGIAEAAFFTALGTAWMLEGKDRRAGLAFAAGCLVAMYVAPTVAAMWLVLLAISRRRAITTATWTIVPLVVVHGFCLLVAGRGYWEGVVLYHLKKPALMLTFGEAFWPLLYHNSHLFLALPLALLAATLEAFGLLGSASARAVARAMPSRAARRRSKHDTVRPDERPLAAALADLGSLARLRDDPRRQLLAFALAGTVASVLFISFLNPVFPFYFVIAFVTAAMLAGYGLGAIARAGWLCVRAWRRKEGLAALAAGLVMLIVAAGAGEIWSQSASVRRSEIPDRVLGVRVPHQWRDAPRLGFVNALLRATVWYDERVLGEHYSALTYYLWHESEVFQAPPEVARYVRAQTTPDATLFGDSQSVSLVALMTERRLALDEADTNAMRFASGITDPRGFVARLEQAPPAVVLVAEDRGFVILPEFAEWIAEHYTVVQTVDDPFDLEYRVYRRDGS